MTQEEHLTLPLTPDVLILPSSNLAPFAREVEKAVCVNPGKLARSEQRGTYAKLTIFPLKKTSIFFFFLFLNFSII